MMKENFADFINKSYSFKEASIELGAALHEGTVFPEAKIKVPLKTLNRHGLIAGATGTGKTKTIQLLSEKLSEAGVPVLMMDLKGDLSGIAKPGEANERVKERCEKLKINFEAKGLPVELLGLNSEPSKGINLKATLLEFGPTLFSKILELNDTQSSIISLLFKYCDDNKLPLINLEDLKTLLKFVTSEGKEEIEQEYGSISPSSLGVIQRKIIELEAQAKSVDGNSFFGEPSFEVQDLIRKNQEGKGIISVLRLTEIQDKPKLFSTFMLSLLGEIFSSFEEVGDLDKPKLIIFIDEAHLIFDGASKTLLDQIETIVKLIRSKGVGIIFCTQNPQDVPDAVLSQLGLKIQHALRAFTAKDRKAIQKAAENYPISEFYEIENVITNTGIGEALVTALSETGTPTPVVWTLLEPPSSRMNILNETEIAEITNQSEIKNKYNKFVDTQSAHEILLERLQGELPGKTSEQPEGNKQNTKSKNSPSKEAESGLDKFFKDPVVRQVAKSAARTAASTITRGLLGMLFGKPARRSRR
ncbi:MAG: helicase HerA-like domain-containing protein [Candidatus Caenarcaniphilales bacterium]|nr:helicase HerA-like domain-containing protein [Candidatus Caenarcaniphilales bacterium]